MWARQGRAQAPGRGGGGGGLAETLQRGCSMCRPLEAVFVESVWPPRGPMLSSARVQVSWPACLGRWRGANQGEAVWDEAKGQLSATRVWPRVNLSSLLWDCFPTGKESWSDSPSAGSGHAFQSCSLKAIERPPLVATSPCLPQSRHLGLQRGDRLGSPSRHSCPMSGLGRGRHL